MSSSHHDDHYSADVKPVSFTVPFILAAVTLLIIFLFLSLCDPKHGHHGEHGYQGAVEAQAAIDNEAKAGHGHHDEAAQPAAKDSVAAPAIAPEVEGKSTESEPAKHEPVKEEAHH